MSRLFDEMKLRGMLENTWIVFASDHGDYATEKGMFAKTESLYECLLHVPLFIVPPEGSYFSKGERTDALVENVDIFPTILGLAGIDIPSYVQGHDLGAWIKRVNAHDPAVRLREHVFAQVGNYHGNLGTTFPTGMPAAGRHRGLLMRAASKDFSFVSDPDYGDEAYDLRNDPWELRNIAGGEGERIEITELRRAVEEWKSNSGRPATRSDGATP
jgi:arylsulfatase A-like enzyme